MAGVDKYAGLGKTSKAERVEADQYKQRKRKAIDWEFEIEDRKAITFRDMTKPKREGPKPEILQNALRSDLSGFYA